MKYFGRWGLRVNRRPGKGLKQRQTKDFTAPLADRYRK